ncbi:MAG: hypothetical protein SFW67_25450 [Myxococcaceae bacterium]|nr:hypothetical protein [Myxococcaceae bacterium]
MAARIHWRRELLGVFGLEPLQQCVRHNDPFNGRYLSPEPLLQSPLFVATMLRRGAQVPAYAYAANNPVRNTDPTGLWINMRGASPALRDAIREMRRSAWGASMFAALQKSSIEFRVMDARFGDRGGNRQLGETGGRGHESPVCGGGGSVDIRLDLRNLTAYNRQIEEGFGAPGDKVMTRAELAGHEFWHAQDYLGGWPPAPLNEAAAEGAEQRVGKELFRLNFPELGDL